jgi:hypothetical protein
LEENGRAWTVIPTEIQIGLLVGPADNLKFYPRSTEDELMKVYNFFEASGHNLERSQT